MIEHRRPGRRRDLVQFTEGGARVHAKLGVVTVAEITINPAGGRHQYRWVVRLPMSPIEHAPASDLDAAKRAVVWKIREWIEAAGLKQRGD